MTSYYYHDDCQQTLLSPSKDTIICESGTTKTILAAGSRLSKPRKQEGRVSFDERIIVHEILHRSDFTSDEKNSYWYSILEMEHQKHLTNHTVLKMENGQKINENQVCTRGLETKTTKGFEFCCRIREAAQKAVLHEQSRQRQRVCASGGIAVINEYCIALAYEEYSSKCQLNAYLHGIEDQIEREQMWAAKSSKSNTKKSRGMSWPSRYISGSRHHNHHNKSRDSRTSNRRVDISTGEVPELARAKSLRHLSPRLLRSIVTSASSSFSSS